MRGLAAYADAFGDPTAREASRRAAVVFLSRKLFRRPSDGSPIRRDFLRLHYHLCYQDDVRVGLKGIGEMGLLRAPQAAGAMWWLKGRELPDGGWPADARFFRVSHTFAPACEYAEWGGGDPRKRNDWFTADALSVLRQAGWITL